MIYECFPVATVERAVDAALESHGVEVAVLPHGGGVVGQVARGSDAAVAELVFARGVDPLAAEARAEGLAELVLEGDGGVEEVKRAGTQRCAHVARLAGGESRYAGGDVYRAGVAKLARRLEYIAALAVVERDGLDIVQGVFAQVDLAVLGVAELDAVVVDAHVVGAHRADVDGLDASDPAVVLELDAREVAEGVGDAVAAECLELLAG